MIRCCNNRFVVRANWNSCILSDSITICISSRVSYCILTCFIIRNWINNFTILINNFSNSYFSCTIFFIGSSYIFEWINWIANFVILIRCCNNRFVVIFGINVSHGLFLISKLPRSWTLNFFKGVTRNGFLICAVVVPDISRFHNIVRDSISSSIHILDCDISTSYWIFCINVSDCLSIRGKLSSWIALYFFKGVTRNRFLFSCIAVSYISIFHNIVWNSLSVFI